MIKAPLGGGDHGMPLVQTVEEVASAYERAKSDVKAAFGSNEVYVEKGD